MPFDACELTWSRGAVDPGTGTPHYINGLMGANTVGIGTFPLPNIVLEEGAYVELEWADGTLGLSDVFTLTQLAVTVTRNPGTPAAQTLTVPNQLWLPLASVQPGAAEADTGNGATDDG